MKEIIKTLYKFIPFKKHLFVIIKSLFKVPPGLYKHLHFKDSFTVKVDDAHKFKIHHYGYLVENEVFWGGLYNNNWESFSLKYWTELCKMSDCIIDVGANTGIYSLIAKSINPKAKVIAFEPVARVFTMLLENNKLNNYDIICIDKALSDFDGEAVIYDDVSHDHTYSVTVNKNLRPGNTNVVQSKISTIRLDTFIQQNNLSKIDLLKIDVETHEPEVLTGFGKYLVQFKPTLIIEILNDEVAEKVESMIKDIPYLYFNINEHKGARQVSTLSKSDNYNFLLCTREVATQLGLLR